MKKTDILATLVCLVTCTAHADLASAESGARNYTHQSAQAVTSSKDETAILEYNQVCNQFECDSTVAYAESVSASIALSMVTFLLILTSIVIIALI